MERKRILLVVILAAGLVSLIVGGLLLLQSRQTLVRSDAGKITTELLDQHTTALQKANELNNIKDEDQTASLQRGWDEMLFNLALKEFAKENNIDITGAADKALADAYTRFGGEEAYFAEQEKLGYSREYITTLAENTALKNQLAPDVIKSYVVFQTYIRWDWLPLDESLTEDDIARLEDEAKLKLEQQYLPLFEQGLDWPEIAKRTDLNQFNSVEVNDERSLRPFSANQVIADFTAFNPDGATFLQYEDAEDAISNAEVALGLKPGEHSGIYKSDSGYYGILRLEQINDAPYNSWDDFMNKFAEEHDVQRTLSTSALHKLGVAVEEVAKEVAMSVSEEAQAHQTGGEPGPNCESNHPLRYFTSVFNRNVPGQRVATEIHVDRPNSSNCGNDTLLRHFNTSSASDVEILLNCNGPTWRFYITSPAGFYAVNYLDGGAFKTIKHADNSVYPGNHSGTGTYFTPGGWPGANGNPNFTVEIYLTPEPPQDGHVRVFKCLDNGSGTCVTHPDINGREVYLMNADRSNELRGSANPHDFGSQPTGQKRVGGIKPPPGDNYSIVKVCAGLGGGTPDYGVCNNAAHPTDGTPEFEFFLNPAQGAELFVIYQGVPGNVKLYKCLDTTQTVCERPAGLNNIQVYVDPADNSPNYLGTSNPFEVNNLPTGWTTVGGEASRDGYTRTKVCTGIGGGLPDQNYCLSESYTFYMNPGQVAELFVFYSPPANTGTVIIEKCYNDGSGPCPHNAAIDGATVYADDSTPTHHSGNGQPHTFSNVKAGTVNVYGTEVVPNSITGVCLDNGSGQPGTNCGTTSKQVNLPGNGTVKLYIIYTPPAPTFGNVQIHKCYDQNETAFGSSTCNEGGPAEVQFATVNAQDKNGATYTGTANPQEFSNLPTGTASIWAAPVPNTYTVRGICGAGLNSNCTSGSQRSINIEADTTVHYYIYYMPPQVGKITLYKCMDGQPACTPEPHINGATVRVADSQGHQFAGNGNPHAFPDVAKGSTTISADSAGEDYVVLRVCGGSASGPNCGDSVNGNNRTINLNTGDDLYYYFYYQPPQVGTILAFKCLDLGGDPGCTPHANLAPGVVRVSDSRNRNYDRTGPTPPPHIFDYVWTGSGTITGLPLTNFEITRVCTGPNSGCVDGAARGFALTYQETQTYYIFYKDVTPPPEILPIERRVFAALGLNILQDNVRDNNTFNSRLFFYFWPDTVTGRSLAPSQNLWIAGIWSQYTDNAPTIDNQLLEGSKFTNLNQMRWMNRVAEVGCPGPTCLERVPLAYVPEDDEAVGIDNTPLGGDTNTSPDGNRWLSIRKQQYGTRSMTPVARCSTAVKAWNTFCGGEVSLHPYFISGYSANHIREVEIANIHIYAEGIQVDFDRDGDLQGRVQNELLQPDVHHLNLPNGSQGPDGPAGSPNDPNNPFDPEPRQATVWDNMRNPDGGTNSGFSASQTASAADFDYTANAGHPPNFQGNARNLADFRDRLIWAAGEMSGVSLLQDGRDGANPPYTVQSEPLTYTAGINKSDQNVLVWSEYVNWSQVDDKGYWYTTRSSNIPTGVSQGTPQVDTVITQSLVTPGVPVPPLDNPLTPENEQEQCHYVSYNYSWHYVQNTLSYWQGGMETRFGWHNNTALYNASFEPVGHGGHGGVKLTKFNTGGVRSKTATPMWSRTDLTGFSDPITGQNETAILWQDTGITPMDSNASSRDRAGQFTWRWRYDETDPVYTDRFIYQYATVPSFNRSWEYDQTSACVYNNAVFRTNVPQTATYYPFSHQLTEHITSVPQTPGTVHGRYGAAPTGTAHQAVFDGVGDGVVDTGWDFTHNAQRVRYEQTFTSGRKLGQRLRSGNALSGNLLYGVNANLPVQADRDFANIVNPTVSFEDADIFAAGGITSYFTGSGAPSAFIFTEGGALENICGNNFSSVTVFCPYYLNPDLDRVKISPDYNSGTQTPIESVFGEELSELTSALNSTVLPPTMQLNAYLQQLSAAGQCERTIDLSSSAPRKGIIIQSIGQVLVNEEITVPPCAVTVIVNGDLHINKPIRYPGGAVASKEDLSSIGFLVTGDIIIDPEVDTMVGAYFANQCVHTGSVLLNKPATGLLGPNWNACNPDDPTLPTVLSSGGWKPNNDRTRNDRPLRIDGLIVARRFTLARQPSGADLAAGARAETFKYDPRIVVNSPLGFTQIYTPPEIWLEAVPGEN